MNTAVIAQAVMIVKEMILQGIAEPSDFIIVANALIAEHGITKAEALAALEQAVNLLKNVRLS
jgi:hypothetical protein